LTWWSNAEHYSVDQLSFQRAQKQSAMMTHAYSFLPHRSSYPSCHAPTLRSSPPVPTIINEVEGKGYLLIWQHCSRCSLRNTPVGYQSRLLRVLFLFCFNWKQGYQTSRLQKVCGPGDNGKTDISLILLPHTILTFLFTWNDPEILFSFCILLVSWTSCSQK